MIYIYILLNRLDSNSDFSFTKKSCVTLGSSPSLWNLSLWNGTNTYFIELWQKLNVADDENDNSSDYTLVISLNKKIL